jgi:hypothetical protein
MTTPAEYRQMADWCEYRAERVAGALREAAETQSKLATVTERARYALLSAARMLYAIHETDPSHDRLEMAKRTEARAYNLDTEEQP